jgi:AAA family ATP:ADP antiporter
VAAVVLVSSVALTLVDFVFKSAAADHVRPADLGTFFATTYFLLNLLSFLAQLFLVNWLLARLGVNRVLAVLPALLLPAAGWVAAGGGLAAALLLKGFDGGLRHSLHRTALEVLYVPLSPEVRNRVKGLIDVLGQRGGQALASLLILAVVALPGPERILAVVIGLLGLVWILVVRTIRTHYLDLFRESLSDLALETRIDFPELDLSSLESLIEALNSPNDREVIAALDLLQAEGRVNLVPALILYHPSVTVVTRALELLPRAGRRDFLPITERLLEHEHPEVRAATLRALAWVAPDPDVYRRFLEDPAPAVAATALIGACSYGVYDRDEGEERMMRLAGEGSRTERIAMARAIQYSPGQAYEGILLLLAESPETDVQQAVVQAMREIRSPLFVPKLLEFLPERVFRGEVRDTLVTIGDEARDQIAEALANPWMSLRIRRQLPRALAHFDSAEAADILQRRLNPEPDGAIRYRILRALLLLREREPDLPLDGKILDRAIERTLSAYFQNLAWQTGLAAGARRRTERATEVQGMILDLLVHKADQTVERLFQLVSLRYPGEDARRLYRGIRSSDPSLKAGSLELVDHLLRTPLREAVLATVDDLPPEERLLRAGPYHERRDLTYERVLLDLLRRPGVGLRTLVVYHIGELRLTGMRETLETLPSDLAGMVTTAVNHALVQLREDGHAG